MGEENKADDANLNLEKELRLNNSLQDFRRGLGKSWQESRLSLGFVLERPTLAALRIPEFTLE
jgi:hypothetical protein